MDGDDNAIIGVYEKRVAMAFTPVYGCQYLRKAWGGEAAPEGDYLGMVDLPTLKGGVENITTTNYTSTASIPANVRDPEAAWTLLKYICIDRADLFAGPKCMNPGYEFKTKEEAEAFYDIIFGNSPGLDVEMAKDVLINYDRTLCATDNTIMAGQAKILEEANADVSLVFAGEMSVEDCLATMKAKGDEYIAADLG